MKLLQAVFLVCHAVDESSGIGKKIRSQVESLERAGFNVALTRLESDAAGGYCRRIIEDDVLEEYNDFLIKRKWKWRIQFSQLSTYITSRKIDLLYIRYTHFANPHFINFLSVVKKSGTRIIMEIPTFPYDEEYRDVSKLLRIAHLSERIFRNFFRLYVDRIITFTSDQKIYGIKTITLDNGVDILNTPARVPKKTSSDLSIIAVSSLEYWHGYDRLIAGLREYYQGNSRSECKTNIVIHIVGNAFTKTARKYASTVESFNLEHHVVFHGYKTGPALDELFNISDIAIGVLGGHRKQLHALKSLKNREYCARGIPFVYSEIDSTFDEQPFIFKVPHNDSPIDMQRLIEWSRTVQHLSFQEREYAKNWITWDRQMSIVTSEFLLLNSNA